MVVLNSTVLDKAREATLGRMKTYGPPLWHFESVAKLWGAFLNIELKPRDIALMMILFKVAREVQNPTLDTKVDIAGYAQTLEMMEQHRKEMEEKAEDGK